MTLKSIVLPKPVKTIGVFEQQQQQKQLLQLGDQRDLHHKQAQLQTVVHLHHQFEQKDFLPCKVTEYITSKENIWGAPDSGNNKRMLLENMTCTCNKCL